MILQQSAAMPGNINSSPKADSYLRGGGATASPTKLTPPNRDVKLVTPPAAPAASAKPSVSSPQAQPSAPTGLPPVSPSAIAARSMPLPAGPPSLPGAGMWPAPAVSSSLRGAPQPAAAQAEPPAAVGVGEGLAAGVSNGWTGEDWQEPQPPIAAAAPGPLPPVAYAPQAPATQQNEPDYYTERARAANRRTKLNNNMALAQTPAGLVSGHVISKGLAGGLTTPISRFLVNSVPKVLTRAGMTPAAAGGAGIAGMGVAAGYGAGVALDTVSTAAQMAVDPEYRHQVAEYGPSDFDYETGQIRRLPWYHRLIRPGESVIGTAAAVGQTLSQALPAIKGRWTAAKPLPGHAEMRQPQYPPVGPGEPLPPQPTGQYEQDQYGAVSVRRDDGLPNF